MYLYYSSSICKALNNHSLSIFCFVQVNNTFYSFRKQSGHLLQVAGANMGIEFPLFALEASTPKAIRISFSQAQSQQQQKSSMGCDLSFCTFLVYLVIT